MIKKDQNLENYELTYPECFLTQRGHNLICKIGSTLLSKEEKERIDNESYKSDKSLSKKDINKFNLKNKFCIIVVDKTK